MQQQNMIDDMTPPLLPLSPAQKSKRRQQLFLTRCMPARVGLALTVYVFMIYTQRKPNLGSGDDSGGNGNVQEIGIGTTIVSVLLATMGAGFVIAYLFHRTGPDSSAEEVGAFGGPVWWNHNRLFHAVLFMQAAVLVPNRAPPLLVFAILLASATLGYLSFPFKSYPK